MKDYEKEEMSRVVISDKTFKKTPQEKIDLANAKSKHKQALRENSKTTTVLEFFEYFNEQARQAIAIDPSIKAKIRPSLLNKFPSLLIKSNK